LFLLASCSLLAWHRFDLMMDTVCLSETSLKLWRTNCSASNPAALWQWCSALTEDQGHKTKCQQLQHSAASMLVQWDTNTFAIRYIKLSPWNLGTGKIRGEWLTGYVDLEWGEIADESTRRQGENCVSENSRSMYVAGRAWVLERTFLMSIQISIMQFLWETASVV
jgi:hypothetical protein